MVNMHFLVLLGLRALKIKFMILSENKLWAMR